MERRSWQTRIAGAFVGVAAEDVARVVVMLASGFCDFMTGQAINVTGGVETNEPMPGT